MLTAMRTGALCCCSCSRLVCPTDGQVHAPDPPIPSPLTPYAESIEIDVYDGRGVQRQRLTDNQSADNGDPERATQLRPLAESDRERQRAEHGRHGRHHDRPEAQPTRLEDRVAWTQALTPL